MNEQEKMKRRISALAFAAHELVLFLDTHPNNTQALMLLDKYRRWQDEATAEYEKKYGKLILTVNDAGGPDSWNWLESPWPWEQEV